MTMKTTRADSGVTMDSELYAPMPDPFSPRNKVLQAARALITAQGVVDLAARSLAAGFGAPDLKDLERARDERADDLLDAAHAMVAAERKRATTTDELGAASAAAKSPAADRLRLYARAFAQSDEELELAVSTEADDIGPLKTQLQQMDAALLQAARVFAEDERQRERQTRYDEDETLASGFESDGDE